MQQSNEEPSSKMMTLGVGRSPHEVDRALLTTIPKELRQLWTRTGRPSRNNRHGKKGM